MNKGAFLILFLAFLLFPQRINNELSTISIISYQIAKNYHYKGFNENKELSQKVLRVFLNQIDPQKRFFLQEDINLIEKEYSSGTLSFFKKGETFIIDQIFSVYYKRMNEREKFLYSLISKNFDFEKKEFLELLKEEGTWLKSKEALNEYWRKIIKSAILSSKVSAKYLNSNESEEKIKARLLKRYENFFKSQRTLSSLEKLKIWLNSLLSNLDAHSSYSTPREGEDYDIQMKLKLTGIGATLTKKDDYVQVVSIIPGGPADKSKKLQTNDIILSVKEDNDILETDLVGMDLSKAVRFIRGEAGSNITLNILRGGENGVTHSINIVRDVVHLEQARAKGKILLSPKREKVIYINVPSFYADYNNGLFKKDKTVSSDVEKNLKGLNEEDVKAAIVDHRFNTGGFLQEAIELSGLFMGAQPIVQTKTKNSLFKKSNINVLKSFRSKPIFTKPLFVLVSAYTASASEIFAAAIQDYNRGFIIGGKRTHGKGTVQIVTPLTNKMTFFKNFEKKNFGLLKYTIQKFYRVNGESTQLKGVRTDISFPSYFEHQKNL